MAPKVLIATKSIRVCPWKNVLSKISRVLSADAWPGSERAPMQQLLHPICLARNRQNRAAEFPACSFPLVMWCFGFCPLAGLERAGVKQHYRDAVGTDLFQSYSVLPLLLFAFGGSAAGKREIILQAGEVEETKLPFVRLWRNVNSCLIEVRPL